MVSGNRYVAKDNGAYQFSRSYYCSSVVLDVSRGGDKPSGDYDVICECFEDEDAELIAAALNSYAQPRVGDA